MKNSQRLLLIVALVATLVCGFLIGRGTIDKETIYVDVPASETLIDSIATERFSAWKDGYEFVMTTEDYQSFLDSLKSANTIIKTVPKLIYVDSVVVDTVYQDIEIPCLPELPNMKFNAHFTHSFSVPYSDSTALISGFYSQTHYPLHTSGNFNDFRLYLPDYSIPVEIRKPSKFWRNTERILWFGAGIATQKYILK